MTPLDRPTPPAWPRLALALAVASAGLYVVGADDAPGATVFATLLMSLGVVAAVRAARLRGWPARGAIAAGIASAVVVATLKHDAVLTAPLAPTPRDVPSTVAAVPAPGLAAAVDGARSVVRSTLWEQRLPGVSVAVGQDGAVVWAEGFGWRDLATRTAVTPDTRFHIGTAAPAIASVAASLGLGHTGADEAADWSPEHIGEPEEDFPGFRFLRERVFTPLGLVHPEPLLGERATFYVPRVDDDPRRGRRLMAMRALACCAGGKAFSSTPSDLVRVAMARPGGDLDGTLAGGRVMSLVTRAGGRLVVAVAANIAHADTATLARRIGETFDAGR